MDLTPDQVRTFVGPKADYYLERWQSLHGERGLRMLGFNWPAFFGTLSWLLYRRMYRWFWIVFVVWVGWGILGTSLVVSLLPRSRGLALLVAIVLRATPIIFGVTCGVYGNYWYYLHTRHQIRQLTPAGRTDLGTVARIGGTNLWVAVVFAVVLYVMVTWTESRLR